MIKMLRPNQSLKVIVAGASGSCSGHYNFQGWAGAPLCLLDGGSNIFAQNYSFIANGSDAPKIEVSFHLLMFAHLGGCLWCEGEGLALCEASDPNPS